MSIPSKQIGQSAESNLLWQICKQLEWINNNTGYNTGTFVPYVGATSTVNLGTQTLSSGHIDVGYDLTAIPLYYDALRVYGQSTFTGTIGTDGAVYGDDIAGAATGSGIGWTGDNFASGYTHTTSGASSYLIAPSITSSGGAYYQIIYTITGRTQGYVNIVFGGIYVNNVSISGVIVNVASVSDFLRIYPGNSFNGRVQISIQSITPNAPLVTLTDSLGQPTMEIRSSSASSGNFAMGNNAGQLLRYGSSYGYGNYCSGTSSGSILTYGYVNTFIGNYSGVNTVTGYNNIGIGYGAGNESQSGNNTIAIGNNCSGNDIIVIGTSSSKTISLGANQGATGYTTIGNSNITSTIIYGNLLLGATSSVGVYKLQVTGSTSLSDPVSAAGSLSGSVLNMTQTWDTTGTPTAIKLNVTNSNSNAASLLLDLQVGGISKFSATAAGVFIAGVNGSANSIYLSPVTNTVSIGNVAVLQKSGTSLVHGVASTTITSHLFNSNSAEAMRIAPNANNLLIGSTTDYAAKLYVAGSTLRTGNMFSAQATPTALTATATLTVAQLLTGIITVTSATAVSLTLPTGTLTDAGVLNGSCPTNTSFDWVVINLGSLVGIVTILAGTAHTFVGLATIPILTQATFRTRKTAAATYVTYRIA